VSTPQVALYIEPPSPYFLRDALFDVRGAAHAGDQILAPYAHLRASLNSLGIPVHTADYLPEESSGTRNIYVSIGNTANYGRIGTRKDTVLSALFAMECPTVEPGMYRALNRAQHHFKRIFSWSDSVSLEPFVGGPLRCERFFWPQSFEAVHEEIWNRGNRGFLVMINGNKRPRFRSPCRELYSERLRGIDYFSRTGDIDLYGFGWDRPTMLVGRPQLPGTFGRVPVPATLLRIERRLTNWWQHFFPDDRLAGARRVYRGFAESKAEILGNYKFALCFENSILKGWVTEKIFDCFFAGTVPVYWGAPDIQDYVPQDCFIDMRQFKDYAALNNYLKSLTERDIWLYKERVREFLTSPRFQPFTKAAFAKLFLGMIEQDAGVKLTGSQPSLMGTGQISD
jgi:hypothetical protein